MMHLDHLPNQKKDEKVLRFVRRHWIAVFKIVLAFVLLAGIPIGIGLHYWEVIYPWLAKPVFGPLITMMIGTYFLFVWLFAFIEFTDYYLDTWIVTNKRILDIEQRGLFNRTSSELHLTEVQDCTAETKGILQTVLDYGHVHVQTAGEQNRFKFKLVPRPERLKQFILEVAERHKREHQARTLRQATRATTQKK